MNIGNILKLVAAAVLALIIMNSNFNTVLAQEGTSAYSGLEVASSTNGADVLVDGKWQGKTPLNEPIRLRPGQHLLTVGKDEFIHHKEVVEIRPGEILRIKVNLQAAEPPPPKTGPLTHEEIRNAIKNALLKLRREELVGSKKILDELIQEEQGKNDPLVWLALGRYYWEGDSNLDAATQALEQAVVLGADQEAVGARWAEMFLETYRKHVGLVKITGPETITGWVVEFEMKLAAPLFDWDRKRLYQWVVPSGGVGKISRKVGIAFPLPAGDYVLGGKYVKVLPGVTTAVPIVDIALPTIPPTAKD